MTLSIVCIVSYLIGLLVVKSKSCIPALISSILLMLLGVHQVFDRNFILSLLLAAGSGLYFYIFRIRLERNELRKDRQF